MLLNIKKNKNKKQKQRGCETTQMKKVEFLRMTDEECGSLQIKEKIKFKPIFKHKPSKFKTQKIKFKTIFKKFFGF